MNANSGGIHAGDGVPTDIDGSTVDYNSAAASDPSGEANAFDAAALIGNGSPATVHDTRFEGNVVTDRLATASFAGPAGSAVELDGPATVSEAVISGNTANEESPDTAGATAGLAILPTDQPQPPTVRVTETQITDNGATAVGRSLCHGHRSRCSQQRHRYVRTCQHQSQLGGSPGTRRRCPGRGHLERGVVGRTTGALHAE